MKSLLIRDKTLRRSFFKDETKRLAFKYLYSDQRVPASVRWKAGLLIKSLPLRSNPIRAKNRCVQTGRSRSIIRDFRLSRINFRNRVLFGQVFGVVKKSW